MYNVDNLNIERLTITTELGRMQLADCRKEEIINMLESGEKLDTFDETVFKNLVQEIKAISQKEIEITYNCGVISCALLSC